MANVYLGNTDSFQDLIGANDRVFGQQGDDTILGGDGNDTLDGGADNDSLVGGEGNDVLYGRDGIDNLDGGNGDDILYADNDDFTGLGGAIDGGAGTDSLYYLSNIGLIVTSMSALGLERFYSAGGADSISSGITFADTTIFGGAGDDTLTGGAGDDLLDGGADNDVMFGGNGQGQDRMYGRAGTDSISGGDDNDFLYGGTGSDTLNGNRDNDYIDGQEDGDRLIGGLGDDTIFGGSGNDTIVGGNGGGGGSNRIELGSGNDVFEIVVDAPSTDLNGAGSDRIVDFSLADDSLSLNGALDGAVHHFINNLFGGNYAAATGAYNDVLGLVGDASPASSTTISGAQLADFVDMIQGQNVAGYSASNVGGDLVMQLGNYSLQMDGLGFLA